MHFAPRVYKLLSRSSKCRTIVAASAHAPRDFTEIQLLRHRVTLHIRLERSTDEAGVQSVVVIRVAISSTDISIGMQRATINVAAESRNRML